MVNLTPTPFNGMIPTVQQWTDWFNQTAGVSSPPLVSITNFRQADMSSVDEQVLQTQIWLTWIPVPGSNGTVIYRSRQTGTPPYFQNWEAGRIGYPGSFFKDGALGPLDAGREYIYQAAPYYNGGEGPLSAPITIQTDIPYSYGYQGYYTAADWQGSVVNEVAAQYTVPTNPLLSPWNIEGEIYLFIGIQNFYFSIPVGFPLSIFQPVVQWGIYGDPNNPDFGSNSHWVAANWIQFNNRFYISAAVTVAAGDILTAKMKRNGPGDWTVSYVEYPAINLRMTGLVYAESWPDAGINAGDTLEFHYIFFAVESYLGFRDWKQNSGDFIIQMQYLNVINTGTSVVTNNFPSPYYITRNPVSGTTISITGNQLPSGLWSIPNPLIQIHLQHDNDWVPVNL